MSGKVYHHRIPGARFIMPDGKDFSFAGGSFNTETISDHAVKAAVEAELQKVADQPTSMIFTKKPIESIEERQAKEEVTKTATQAFDSTHNVPPGTRTVEIPMAPHRPPELNPRAENLGGQDLTKKIEEAKAKVASASK